MKCYNCSATIEDNSAFCTVCGANQGFTSELIERAKHNDQYALTELYNKTYSNVYYTVIALIKDEDAALDVLQDSYIKAFKNLDQLKEANKFRAWIKRIAHNRAIDHLRAHKPVLFTQMESDENDEPIEFEDTNIENLPEEVIDRDETSRLMHEILDSLPDEQRAVLSMFYYEQLSVSEIAAELGVSEGTVKSRLNYGRKKVEAKVLELEKKGTKLYGLAPIPFMLFLFKKRNAYPAPVPPKAKEQILSSLTQPSPPPAPKAAPSVDTSTGTVLASGAKKGLIGALKSSLLLKIIAGVLAVSLVVGGVTTAYYIGKQNEKAETGSFGGMGSGNPSSEGGGDTLAQLPTQSVTQPPTESQTETPTQAPTESSDSMRYQSYFDSLQSFQTVIKNFENYGTVQRDSVAFADLTGDGKDEMIYAYMNEAQSVNSLRPANVAILSYDETANTVINLFNSSDWLEMAETGGESCLIVMNNELYLYSSNNSMEFGWMRSAYRLTYDGRRFNSSTMIENPTISGNVQIILTATPSYEDYPQRYLIDSSAENLGMTYDEAITFLNNKRQ